MELFTSLITDQFARRGIAATDRQIGQFALYGEFLLEYNQKVNLTAVKTPEEVVEKHFCDSLTALALPQLKKGARCADIGTGAGFPGVPLAIMRPDISVLLVDALKKRLVFLEELAKKLELPNVSTLHSRSEDGGRNPQVREKYDIALSRAVARLPVLCELNLPFVKVGGYMLAYKGPAAAEEIPEAAKAMAVLGGRLEDFYRDPGDTETRHGIVIIQKIKPTPPKYPRQAGKPEKEPIL